jgi:hypothetical protein
VTTTMPAALLATLLMFENGLAVMPLVIVAVVVAHVVTARTTSSSGPGDAGPAVSAAPSQKAGPDVPAS